MNVDFEFVYQTYLSNQPIFRGLTELTFCESSDCSAVKYILIKTELELASSTTLWLRKGQSVLICSRQESFIS